MLKTIIDIESLKDFLEGALNWWLSYTMSQPVSFDLTILVFFLLEYFGAINILTQVRKAMGGYASTNAYQLDDSMMAEEKYNTN